MSDEEGNQDSVEERLDDLEKQVDDMDVNRVVNRVETIESEQSQLQHDLDVLVESLREQGTEIPHIDSVEQLYHRLESHEKELAALRQSLEDILSESE